MNVAIAQVYPARIDAAQRLIAADAAGDGEALREIAERLRVAAVVFGRAPAAKEWRAYADAVEITAMLIDWHSATRDAQSDADRFLRAARVRLKEIESEAGEMDFGAGLCACFAPLGEELSIEQVRELRSALAKLPLPIAIFAHPILEPPSLAKGRQADEKPEPEDVAVAFLEFTINGKAAETLQSLTPGQVHDLDLAIRVSRWPASAERLVVTPITIEPRSIWDFPSFEFPKPSGEPPFVFQRKGRMTVTAPQGINARPLEFRYAAEFQPLDKEERVVVAGQRTLLLDGSPATAGAFSGDSSIDRAILALREKLRLEPRITQDEIRDMITLLGSVGNLMWQSAKGNIYTKAITEAEFQADFQRHLRANTAIGSELEEQSVVARGKSDLSFRSIRIELKSERTKLLAPTDCEQYAAQAASYAVGSAKTIALLCVLDCSPKTGVPFPVADGLTIFPVATATAPIYVVTALVQGNLGKPSDLSR